MVAFIFIACNKTSLDQHDIVNSLISRISGLSKLDIQYDYFIEDFILQNEHDQLAVSSVIVLDKKEIELLSANFKKMRRNADGPGYGKYPSGWEYYARPNDREQYKMIIDTFTNQLKISHEIYFGLP